MIELIFLIPFFLLGLVVFIFVDLRQPQAETQSLELLMEEIKEQAIEEMRYKVMEFHGNEKIKEKKLNTYEDFYEELEKIENKRKLNA